VKLNFATIKRAVSQLPGWHTNRKIVVFESDDWGSIRMSSKKNYQALLQYGLAVDKDPYCKYDSLESKDDLTALFDVLIRHRDANGNHPTITVNTIVANPDFGKIKKDNFTKYHYQLFTETMLQYYSESNVFEIWQQGITEKLFQPQFHGREHVNIRLWLKELQNGNKQFLQAFDCQVFGVPASLTNYGRSNVMASYDMIGLDELEEIDSIIVDGLNIFEQIFRFKSSTFIAPCYIWHPKTEIQLFHNGIAGIQGIAFQHLPIGVNQNYETKFHYTGQKNNVGQYYMVRNCGFEPSLQPENYDIVSDILNRMKWSFFLKKPVIISTHRINFIGGLEEKNRKKNLDLLNTLLGEILKKYPDVEFMSSDNLIKTMSN
jgi:hypothetical protein